MKNQSISILVAVMALVALTVGGVGAVQRANAQASAGAVYIMTNDPSGNRVVVYDRATDGSLTWVTNVPTNGLGLKGLTGSNQGGLVLSRDGSWLFVVNAGSNDLSVFAVSPSGLTLTDKVASGGLRPVSVTVFENWIYVLDNGTSNSVGNIAGFYLSSNGQLSPIGGSIQPLSTVATTAQISFNRPGTILVVALKSANVIDTYTVSSQGVASGPMANSSSGAVPFGFAFDARGQLIVSEAGGGPSGTSAVSSYAVSSTGVLTTISGSVADTQIAACWEVVTGNNRFTYTANAHSGTISSYAISPSGTLSLLNAVAANTGPGDLDMSLSRNSQFLYVFVHGSNSIEGFSVSSDGSLDLVTTVSGVAATADGLAAN